jgi:hypothetical protein
MECNLLFVSQSETQNELSIRLLTKSRLHDYQKINFFNHANADIFTFS